MSIQRLYRAAFLLASVSIPNLSPRCEAGIVMENQDAWIYPGKVRKGFHLTYSETANWADLWSLLIANGFYSVGKFCVKGAFILYEEPNFAVTKLGGYDIVSGRNRCKMIESTTKSIQLLGSMGHLRWSSITFFEKLHFGSQAHPTVFNQGSYFFRDMDQTLSAVLIGRLPWTIEMKNGFRFCVQSEFDNKARLPICLIRSFPALLMNLENPNFEFVRVSQTCVNVSTENIHKIQDCTYWGTTPTATPGQAGSEIFKGEDLPSPSSSMAGGSLLGPDFCSNDEKKKRIFSLYKAAVTGGMDGLMAVEWSKLGKNAWKVELLDTIFSIVMAAIDPETISINFLSRTRELFVQKLASAWGNESATDEIDLPNGQYDYDTLMERILDCPENIRGVEGLHWHFRDQYNKIETTKDLDSQINPEFVRKPELDIITEMVWIAGHFVGHMCHNVLNKLPFWALYYNIFYNFYMVPVIPVWKTPTEGLSLIFGGLNYHLEYKKLAFFASLAIKGMTLELLKRPPELTKANNGTA